jgi:hypothetical protein
MPDKFFCQTSYQNSDEKRLGGLIMFFAKFDIFLEFKFIP